MTRRKSIRVTLTRDALLQALNTAIPAASADEDWEPHVARIILAFTPETPEKPGKPRREAAMYLTATDRYMISDFRAATTEVDVQVAREITIGVKAAKEFVKAAKRLSKWDAVTLEVSVTKDVPHLRVHGSDDDGDAVTFEVPVDVPDRITRKHLVSITPDPTTRTPGMPGPVSLGISILPRLVKSADAASPVKRSAGIVFEGDIDSAVKLILVRLEHDPEQRWRGVIMPRRF